MDDFDQVTWETSHLPALQNKDITAILDLIRAWFEGRSWSAPCTWNVPLIWEYAERHGFSGLFGSLVRSGNLDIERLTEKIDQRYLTNILYHEKCMHIGRCLQSEAALLDIPLSFFKGPTLVQSGYKDPGIRSYSDMDIFVESREDAWKLIKAADCMCSAPCSETGIIKRLLDPGRIKAHFMNWELEFCYPVIRPGDPQLMLLAQEKNRILKYPTDQNELGVPDTDIYFIFLILHMSWHLCSRLIWFMDLCAYTRLNMNQLDMNWIERKLADLQMLNLASHISQFCKTYIDPDFPLIGPANRGWNHAFQMAMTSVGQIGGNISVHHKLGWRKYLTYILSPTRFYLITDAQPLVVAHKSCASRWSAFRLLHAFDIRNKLLGQILTVAISVFSIPFVRFMVYIASYTKIRGDSNTRQQAPV